MKPLYPPIKQNSQHMLEVTSPHSIYVEECGSPRGIPILFVHGGPGAGCSPDDRRFFDPERFRIILFDQRGCGRSIPYGSIEKNTTQELINDIEKIREFFEIDSWVLFGGSWGSTLSLLYAQKHPKRVKSMILRGVFLGRERELQWFYQYGTSLVFPDHWEEFIFPIPEEERDNLIDAYYKRLTGEDEIAKMNAAKHWSQYEGQCATLHPNKTILEHFTNSHTALSLALIETHYFKNRCFIEPNQILRDAYKLEGIPGVIVHGRYDMICPFENARALHLAWPESELYVIRDAGHAALEPGITDALINATEKLTREKPA
ncbi:MAG: prolyl aminopeptidase [Candidatus Berkiellales bacterium]